MKTLSLLKFQFRIAMNNSRKSNIIFNSKVFKWFKWFKITIFWGLILLAFLFLFRGGQNSFDFSELIESGHAKPGNKKFLTYLYIDTANTFPLGFCCTMYSGPLLDHFIESPKHDVIFLIEMPEDQSSYLKPILESWCFDNYAVIYQTPDFFKPQKKSNVTGISFVFSSDGKELAMSNPSIPGFRQVME